MADTRNTTPKAETTQKPAPGRTATTSKGGPGPDEIPRRAYELFQKRGGKHGYHVEDWYEAERQLHEERQRPTGGLSQDGASVAPSAAKTTAKKSAAKKATAKKSAAKKSAAKKSAAKKTSGA